jgi:hypothetical protein
MQMNLGAKVQLVIIDIPRNLNVPFVSRNPFDILAWNRKVNEYITTIFDFAKKFLASNRVVLLFHMNDTITKGVPLCQVISLDFERIH